jgi:hypothetical protein
MSERLCGDWRGGVSGCLYGCKGFRQREYWARSMGGGLYKGFSTVHE